MLAPAHGRLRGLLGTLLIVASVAFLSMLGLGFVVLNPESMNSLDADGSDETGGGGGWAAAGGSRWMTPSASLLSVASQAMHGHRLAVYVYPLPAEFTDSMIDPKTGLCAYDRPEEYEQYATEIVYPNFLRSSRVRTWFAASANFFFVPLYPLCFMKRWMMAASRQYPTDCPYPKRWEYAKVCSRIADSNENSPIRALDAYYRNALHWIHDNYPLSTTSSGSTISSYWSTSKGRNHIFVFPHGAGANDYLSWQRTIRHSIFLTPEGNARMAPPLNEPKPQFSDWFRFESWKDIAIPGYVAGADSLRTRAAAAVAIAKPRDIYLFFRGSMHGPTSVRSRIRSAIEKAQSEDPVSRTIIMADFTLYGNGGSGFNRAVVDTYHNELLQSVFCLIVRGTTIWSRRLYESILSGCIPVICNDEQFLPFQDLLRYESFSVFVPEAACTSESPLAALNELTGEQILAKQRALQRVSRIFGYGATHETGDAFSYAMIELERKLDLMEAARDAVATTIAHGEHEIESTVPDAGARPRHNHVSRHRRLDRGASPERRRGWRAAARARDSTNSSLVDEWADGLIESFAGTES